MDIVYIHSDNLWTNCIKNVLPRIRVVLFLLLGLRLLLIILSQCEALQIKQSTLEMQILDISIVLFCKGNILVDPNNPMLSC